MMTLDDNQAFSFFNKQKKSTYKLKERGEKYAAI